MKSWLLFLAILFTVPVFGTGNTDSLRAVMKTQQGEARIETMCTLADQLPKKASAEALQLLREALNSAVALSNDKLIVRANSVMGNVYEGAHQYPEAIAALKEALRVAERTGDQKKIGVICTNIGRNIFSNTGDMKEAMSYYLRALEIYQKINEPERMARTYVNIANLMGNQGDLDGALGYYKKALPVIKDSVALAGVINNIGAVYNAKKDYRSSLEWLEKALGVKQRIGMEEDEIASSYNNIGSVLINLNENEKALDYLGKALTMNTASGDSEGIAMNQSNIGSVYFSMNKLDKAEQYVLLGNTIAEKKQMKNLLMENLLILSKIYAQQGNYKAAHAYLERHREMLDNQQKMDLQQQIASAQARIDAREKEQQARENELKQQKENELLQVENQRQNLFIGMLVIGAIGLLITAALFLLRYREKKRANLLLENRSITIEAQKFEIEVKNREITDSINYAQRLQQAVLPGEQNLRDLLPDAFVLFLPRDIVSGDFFWCASSGSYKVIAVADCTGHGVPGALLSMIGNNLLHQAVYEKKMTSPGRILSEMNKGLKSLLLHQEHTSEQVIPAAGADVRDGMDISLCVIDTNTRQLRFAGANRLLVLIRNGELTELPADRTSIGGLTPVHFEFTEKTMPLENGDCLYMFTDGYADQFGGDKGKKLMTRSLKQLLQQHAARPMEEQKNLLAKHFHDWKGNYGQVDDVLLTGIRIG